MIELIWVVIAALGIATVVVIAWNALYMSQKLRNQAINELGLDALEHSAKLELLEEIIDRHVQEMKAKLAVLEAAPIMFTPAFKEGMYQWMQERNAMEHDPEFIIRSQGGECGRNRPNGS